MLDQSDDNSALTSQSENRSVAIIGSGLIGSSWAIVFSRAGWTVRLFDSDKNALDKAEPLIAEQIDLLIVRVLIQHPGDRKRSSTPQALRMH